MQPEDVSRHGLWAWRTFAAEPDGQRLGSKNPVAGACGAATFFSFRRLHVLERVGQKEGSKTVFGFGVPGQEV